MTCPPSKLTDNPAWMAGPKPGPSAVAVRIVWPITPAAGPSGLRRGTITQIQSSSRAASAKYLRVGFLGGTAMTLFAGEVSSGCAASREHARRNRSLPRLCRRRHATRRVVHRVGPLVSSQSVSVAELLGNAAAFLNGAWVANGRGGRIVRAAGNGMPVDPRGTGHLLGFPVRAGPHASENACWYVGGAGGRLIVVRLFSAGGARKRRGLVASLLALRLLRLGAIRRTVGVPSRGLSTPRGRGICLGRGRSGGGGHGRPLPRQGTPGIH